MNKEALGAAMKEAYRVRCDPTEEQAMIGVNVTGAIKTYLSAVFHKIDEQEPSTWPKSEFAPSGAHWLVWFKQPALLRWNGAAFCDDDYNYYHPVAYADPADLFVGDV